MLVPSLEFLGGIVVGGLLAMLPLTPVIYVTLSILLLGVVAHMSWRIAKLAKIGANKLRFVFSAALTIALAALLAWGYSIRFSKHADAQGVQGSCNNFGNNNTNCNVFNFGVQKRTLAKLPALKQQLLGLSKTRKYEISTVWGDAEATNLAFEIEAFLKQNGFDVIGVNQVTFRGPVKGLQIEDKPDSPIVGLIVGSQ